MIPGLLLFAVGLRAIDDVVSSLIFLRRSRRYHMTTVSSDLVLTPEEQEAWDRPDTDVETRVAIFRRGLLRYKVTHSHGRPHGGAE